MYVSIVVFQCVNVASLRGVSQLYAATMTVARLYYCKLGNRHTHLVFNGVVTMHTKTQAFLPLLIQGYIHTRTVYVCAPPWYALLPQYKLHSRYAAACKPNERKY